MKAVEQLNNEHITEQVSADDIAKFQTQIAGQISAIMASAYLKTCEGKYYVFTSYSAHTNGLSVRVTEKSDCTQSIEACHIYLDPLRCGAIYTSDWVCITQELEELHQLIKDLD